jgi:hypothetical protein
MPPVPVDAFAREFRALPGADRTAFVAALWSASGWETRVKKGVVIAHRDGEQRQIAVVDPGRFGTPDLTGVDTLVTARDRGSIRAAASEAGIEYVSPTDLRGLLLYGVEREVAEQLYEEHVGKPLSRAVPENAGDSGTLLPEMPQIGVSRRALAVIAVLALVGVALAGPGLPGWGPEPAPVTVNDVTPENGTVDAVGVATAEPTERPDVAPGLTLDGIKSGIALADAHITGVRNRPRVIRTRMTGPPNSSAMGGLSRRNTTTWIANDSHFFQRASAVGGVAGPGGTVTVETYADGGPVYRRYAVENETPRYFRYSLDERSATDDDSDVQAYLYHYFVGAEDTVVTCAGENDSDCSTYRVAVDDPPSVLGENVEDYEAMLIVSERGVITRIRVSYTLPDEDGDGEREQMKFALDYRFKDVKPEAPEWLGEAKNATTNGTETTTDDA